jgi:hypothetical protein
VLWSITTLPVFGIITLRNTSAKTTAKAHFPQPQTLCSIWCMVDEVV